MTEMNFSDEPIHDLEYVPTSTLIVELQKRHEASLVLLLKPEKLTRSILDVVGCLSGDPGRVWGTLDSLRLHGFFEEAE
jgi:hypothetical protein